MLLHQIFFFIIFIKLIIAYFDRIIVHILPTTPIWVVYVCENYSNFFF